MRWPRIAIVLAVLAVGLGGFAMLRGCSSDVLARLVQSEGKVERDRAQAVEQWADVEQAAQFRLGDGLRTHRGARALLHLSAGGKVRVDAETTIRFRGTQERDAPPALDVEYGQALVEAGEVPMKVHTTLGLAVLDPRSKMRVVQTDGGHRFTVEFGAARFPELDGGSRTASSGETLTVGIGLAELDAPEPTPDVPPEEPSSGVTAEVVGDGVTIRRPGEEQHAALPAGESGLDPGSDLRLPRDTRVKLRRGDERAELRGAGQYIIGVPGEGLVEARAGGVEVEAGPGDVTIAVPGGMIVSRGGPDGPTRASVAVRGEVTELEVSDGLVDTEHGGERMAVRAGEKVTLGAAAPSTDGSEAGPGLDYADLEIAAGDSLAVYDPSPPTAVGFDVDRHCSGGALVRVGRQRAQGTGRVSLALPKGRHRYRVHCLGADGPKRKVVASGRVRIVRATGARRLPRAAPRNRIELDGRRYRVMFQHRGPQVEVRWPDAPAAKRYTLRATFPGGRKESITTQKPRHVFRSGEIPEGESSMAFEAAGGERSPTTAVVVQFDSAAHTVSLREPPVAGFARGGPVEVAGVVMAGSKVSVGDEPLTLSKRHFSADVQVGESQRALAVRIHHPRTGVRYYLRRAEGVR